LTIAGSIHSTNATPVKTVTALVQLNQTKPNISQLQISRTQYQAAGIDPFVLIPIVLVGGLVIADIQQEMVKSEQSVHIADLKAKAQIKQANGEAEGTKLRSIAEAEGIRATGNAKA